MINSNVKGFGLAEQIITLAVLAVLTAIAIPAFHRMMMGHELRAAQTDYIAALQHARNLAVNEQVRITFFAQAAMAYIAVVMIRGAKVG
ncbi:pilus assembly FimT family protein [Dyella nitratireducens]|nr:prepilin-type N-terminal cleavage/methylation domain-containing protein [Dyella nitratireducens]